MSHPPPDSTSPLSDPADHGQAPPDDGATRLRLRWPHCHNPLQLADDRTDEVLCPACGSSFRVPDARQTSTTSGTRQLGKFLLLERVGAGAFGAVWKARDPAGGKSFSQRGGYSGGNFPLERISP